MAEVNQRYTPNTPDRSTEDLYTAEEFSSEEAAILSRYFTNLDQPVFALINLPEVVKGALFARYSRSTLSLRRLFLNEFLDDLPTISPSEHDVAVSADATVGLQRAEALYDRVFFEYGDDSVAQLGGVHLACEQSSNLLTKVLEWGRIMSYLEQSTRYVIYNRDLAGNYRYFRDPEIMTSALRDRYVNDLDSIFAAYIDLSKRLIRFLKRKVPKVPGDSDFAYRSAIKARALDAVRGMLPAATLSNVGIYGSGQAYEALLLRMRSHPLHEVRFYAQMMLTELRKVIPSFLKRVDLVDRGQVTSRYLATNRESMNDLSSGIFGVSGLDRSGVVVGGASSDGAGDNSDTEGFAGDGSTDVCMVDLVDFDPEGEEKMIAAMLYPYTSLPERAIADVVRDMSLEQRLEVVRTYCGNRTNRRHRPGRALERVFYRFDVLSDYGAFRDLQRHRMLTIEWQPLSTRHGYVMPEDIVDIGAEEVFKSVMSRSADLYEKLSAQLPHQAAYAVSLAYRVRYYMHFNAREAMHMLELRTGSQAHPAYRDVCQKMYHLIADRAGHRAVAAMMVFVQRGDDPVLGRLQAENKKASGQRPTPSS
ncbi:MAG: FAD-dependent thymidylate synthase [Acidimicrobiaceae bacterium]|nr:FAD-dependent thymidylate synthase [Acidimicrobiaceae bacterium]